MHVEVAHVADDDQVDATATPRTGDQADPGGSKLRGEQRHEPRTAEHLDARGSVQPKGNVAFEHLVAERGEAFLQDADARVAAGVVGAEEENAPARPIRARRRNRNRGRMADRHARGIVRSSARLEFHRGHEVTRTGAAERGLAVARVNRATSWAASQAMPWRQKWGR